MGKIGLFSFVQEKRNSLYNISNIRIIKAPAHYADTDLQVLTETKFHTRDLFERNVLFPVEKMFLYKRKSDLSFGKRYFVNNG